MGLSPRNRTVLIWVVVALGACCLLAVVIAGAYYLLGRGPASRPVVDILTPHHLDQVTVGALIPVSSTSRDPSGKVVRVELWADAQLVQTESQPNGVDALSVSQGWQPVISGTHTLVVRAFNRGGVSGQAAVSIESVQAPDADQDGVPDSEDAAPNEWGPLDNGGVPIGGADASPEVADAGPPVPGGSDSLSGGETVTPTVEEVGPPAPGGEEPPPDEGELPPDGGSDEAGPAESAAGDEGASGTGLEFEVISLKTDADFAGGTFCYVKMLSSDWERVPAEQESFAHLPGPDHSWDVAPYLGGENGRLVTVPDGEFLTFRVMCLGRVDDFTVTHLGDLTRDHPPEDWNGTLFTAQGVEGGHWFELTYRICPVPCEGTAVIPPPYNLRLTPSFIPGFMVMRWNWDGVETDIDGFRFYRNGVPGPIRPANVRSMVVPISALSPPCSSEYRFRARAYRGPLGEGPESGASNTVYRVGVPCVGDDGLYNLRVNQFPSGAPVFDVLVDYQYASDHGDNIWIGALPYPSAGFGYSPVLVPHGNGTATISLTYLGTGPFSGNYIDVFMYDGGGNTFHTQRFDWLLNCAPSLPDLTVTAVDQFRDTGEVRVHIRNQGWAPVLNQPMTFAFHLPGGGDVVPPDGLWPDISIPVGASVTLSWPGLPGTAFDALRDGFDAVVDPGNAIPEVREDNNTLHVAPSTRVRVEFLRVRTPDSCGWFVINADYVFRLYAGYGPAAPAPVHWVMDNFRVPPVGNLHGPVGGQFNIAGPANTALFDLSTDQSVHVGAVGNEHDFWGDHFMGSISQWYGTGAGEYTASSVHPGCHFEIDYRVSPVP